MKRITLLLISLVVTAFGQDAPAPVLEPEVDAPDGAAEAFPDQGGEAPATESGNTPRAKTESTSRQFVIHGSDFVTRGAVASLAEEVRGKLMAELGEDRDWEHSIAIQLHGRVGDAAPARSMRSQFFWVPGGFRLQLDVHLAKGKPSGLERALLELLLIERGLRGKGADPVDGDLSIPAWLLDGLLESFRWRQGDRDRELYAALFEKNQLFPVERLLEVERPGGMDSMTGAAFRASSGALVMALLSQAGGQAGMNSMLGEVATFEGDEMALLMKHFPGMNLGKASFAKWWALQLARLSETSFTQILTINATEAELQRLLVVRFQDASGVQYEIGADQFRDLLALPLERRKEAVEPVVERAGIFLYRAFPAHRPILAEYVRILGEIVQETDNSVEERLQSLAEQRADLAALGRRTRDYLEWFRITNARQISGDFESFIELKENLEATPERRRGPISEYLDDLQKVYGAE